MQASLSTLLYIWVERYGSGEWIAHRFFFQPTFSYHKRKVKSSWYKASFGGILSSKSKVIQVCIGFASLHSVIGLEKLVPFFQRIGCKTKTNYNLVARVFPSFRQFGCFYIKNSLGLKGISLSSEKPLQWPWLWFCNSQSKRALTIM